MRLAFLVGNGFDMAMGLETGSEAFLKYFITSNENHSEPGHALSRHIATQGVKTWADFEAKMGEYSEGFNLETREEYLDSCDSLITGLSEYLEKQDTLLSDEFLKNEAVHFFDPISSFIDQLEEADRDSIISYLSSYVSTIQVDFICFNYTSTLKRLLNNSAPGSVFGSCRYSSFVKGSFVQCHGSLDKYIICGVDNETQIKNSELALDDEVRISLVKNEGQRGVSSKDDIRAVTTINEAQFYCVFGLSMGTTDRRWWRAIAEQLATNSEKKLFIFSHTFDRENIKSVRRFTSAVRKEKDHFCFAAGLDEEKSEQIFDQIYILEDKYAFNFPPKEEENLL